MRRNPPIESVGASLTSDMTLQLVDRLPNLAGVVDCSLEWVYQVEVVSNGRKKRPPVRNLGEVEYGKLEEAISGMAFLRAEPRGW